MTWRKTSRVSNAVALDPNICLKFKALKQRKLVHENSPNLLLNLDARISTERRLAALDSETMR